MNLRKSLSACCLCLVIGARLYSQSVDKNGYYINLKGDTVFGKFNNYPEYSKSPASVVFQLSGASQAITLTPEQCIKFSVAQSDTYLSFKGKRLVNATNYEGAGGDGNTKDTYEEVTLFLRQLFNDGHYQLYELKDSRRSNFYVRSDSVGLKELYYKETIVDMNVVQSHAFQDQLSFVFFSILDKNPGLQRQLQRAKYDNESLTRLFNVMTTGKAPGTRLKYPAQFFAGLGASVNMFSVSGNTEQVNNVVGTYGSQTSPFVELGIRLFMQRNYGRLFYMFRLNAYKYENKGSFTDMLGNKNDNSFKASVISLPVSVGYKFIDKASTAVAFSAGVSILHLSNNMQNRVQESNGLTYQLDNSTTMAFNVFGEAEAVWRKKASFFAGYYLPATVGSYTYYAAHHSSLRVGLRYCFN